MRSLTATFALLVPVVTVLVQMRSLFARRPRGLPPERDDGVAIVRLETSAVAHPTPAALRRNRFYGGAFLVVIGLGFVCAYVIAADGSPWLAAVLVVELLVLLPMPVLALRRSTDPGTPADSFTVCVHLRGSIDAIATRLQRALFEMGALGLTGTSIVADNGRFSIEGGVGLWGASGDSGYHLRATAVPVDDGCNVTVASANYAPSLIQGLRNQRNVALVLRHLVA